MKQETITGAPFARSDETAFSMTADVLIALIPALIWGVYAYGLRALVVTVLCLLFSLAFQALFKRLFHPNQTINAFGACLYGLMLAMILPASVPLWVLPILSLVLITLAPDAIGGIGKGFVPSIVLSKLLYFACFPAWRGHFPLPFVALKPFSLAPSAEELLIKTTSLTPLLQWRESGSDEAIAPSALLTGSTAACIGEGAGILLLCGLLYLMIRRVIAWQIPVLSLATALILTFLFPRMGDAMQYAPAFLLSGGMIFCCGFLAPLFGTAPVTRPGRIITGVLLGALCVLARFFLSDAMGAYFAVLFVGVLSPWLDRLCAPIPFGARHLSRPTPTQENGL